MKELERNKETVTASHTMDPGSLVLDTLDRFANAMKAVVDRIGRVMARLVVTSGYCQRKATQKCDIFPIAGRKAFRLGKIIVRVL